MTCDSLVLSFRAQARNLCHSRSNGQCQEMLKREACDPLAFGHHHLQKAAQSAINRLLETHSPALFHTASALSAPSGHLPLEGKAIPIKRRSRHLHSKFSLEQGFYSRSRDDTSQRLPLKARGRTSYMLHYDKKCCHYCYHKETVEELPPERLPILLCRDLEAAMRAILQPHDIRHRAMAMRTPLAVPRRILRALLHRQLRHDLHRRIQQPAPARRAETEHIPLIHPPAPSAAHRTLRQWLLQHLMTRRTSVPALPHPMPAIRTLCKMRPRRLPAPRLRCQRRL